ncbi:hypothetical protein [Campylobacter jejuni]|uniref:hypothetical protein n=1 Tax=Campylobacter jejuni TaxID=197 RepID=UPI00204409BD|nr:hypothetical protein [Campylobacter jejuni]GKY28352.1 hypothetical protein THJ062_16200 [Campylobacter jejuni]
MNKKDKQIKEKIQEFEDELKRHNQKCNEILQSLKNLLWDRQSKKESSQMYKVLKEDKTHTRVKSNVGDIKVDKDFMEKEIKKHLDNPNLRGMVTTQEMLSFPKVAKNVEAINETRGYTWQAKTNDEKILVYGSRKYEIDGEKIHRLVTNHSKTETNERKVEMDGRSHPHHPIFNDFNFRKSTNENIITQKHKTIIQQPNSFINKFKEFKDKQKKQNINIEKDR